MRFNQKYRYRMGVEALEEKRLLAGDVTASVVEGTLVIRGDEASNGVAVTSGDAPDTYVIAGLPVGDADTSINGVFDAAVVSGVTHGIRMAMGDGHDLANLFRANVRGNVAIGAGQGNDHVNVGGPLTSANDANTVIHGRLVVELGDGHDSLRVGGSGIGHGMAAHGGMGNDYVAIAGSGIRGILGIHTGQGNDHVAIGRTHAASVRLGTGAGADQVALVDSTFAAIAVNTGEGNDGVAVAGVRARAAWFHGGAGNDALQFNGASHFGRLRIGGFETVGGSSNVELTVDGQSHDDTGGGDKLVIG